MDGRIVKFNTLTDADRSGTQHDDRRLIRNRAFIFVFIRGIEIRNIGAELAGAGINHLVDRHQSMVFAPSEHFQFALAQDFAQVLI